MSCTRLFRKPWTLFWRNQRLCLRVGSAGEALEAGKVIEGLGVRDGTSTATLNQDDVDLYVPGFTSTDQSERQVGDHQMCFLVQP